jgi:glutamine amidotransferase
MRATIFDYGAGNLHSLAKALESAGARVSIEPDPAHALQTDLLVLPGVGAFAAAAERIAPARESMRAALQGGLPCLGVCLGMQLLFDASEEGPGLGLGLIAGRVTKIRARRVPQIGWNTLEDANDPLFEQAPLAVAYFANGYACRPDDQTCVIARCTHESDRFPAAVRCGLALGVQFHPEKSSRAGLAFVSAFVREVSSRHIGAAAGRDSAQIGDSGTARAVAQTGGPTVRRRPRP